MQYVYKDRALIDLARELFKREHTLVRAQLGILMQAETKELSTIDELVYLATALQLPVDGMYTEQELAKILLKELKRKRTSKIITLH